MTDNTNNAAPVTVLVVAYSATNSTERVHFLGNDVQIQTVGCDGDIARAIECIQENDGRFDAIGIDGWPMVLQLGGALRDHDLAARFRSAATSTPLVDGSGVRAALERWAVLIADRVEPGMLADKKTLMCPGLNHAGLAQAFMARHARVRYADAVTYLGLPEFPVVGARRPLEQAAPAILETLGHEPPERLWPSAEPPAGHRHHGLFRWAHVLAGDASLIRRFAPDELKHKTVVAECVSSADIDDFRRRGVSIVVTLMPSLDESDSLARHGASILEAVLVASRPDRSLALSEDTYLDMIADLDWRPGIRYLQAGEDGINRFAFVIHPLSIRQIHSAPGFAFTRYLPDGLVEWFAARMPPMYMSKVTGAQSPVTGQRVEGYLYSIAATPRQLMRRGVRSTYTKLHQIALRAQHRRARIMGLGAFTSVVGDAGKTVAHESDIAITSGNSLTVAATLEAAKQAVVQMGSTDLTKGRAMIVGATGSIGAVCARLIAQAIRDVVLISVEPERLIDLKRRILRETPGSRVVIGTHASVHLPDCDLVITATSAFGQRVVDISRCKPGAVVCDVARPHDISPAEAAVRPDVLVIDSGEVLIPGNIDFGYDIGLPPGIAYACLAETCLLAMDGRFEDYTIGRDLEMSRVKEIYRIFRKHEFQIAGLHSFDETVTEEALARKRELATRLRDDDAHRVRTMEQAEKDIAKIPIAAKGVAARRSRFRWSRNWLTPIVAYVRRRFAQH